MSIINEALRKAEEENKKRMKALSDSSAVDKAQSEYQSKTENRVTESTTRPPLPVRKRTRNKKFAVLIILLLFAGGLAGFISFKKMLLPKLSGNIVFRISTQNIVPAALSDNVPKLTLNGIVYDEERPYAIVNNRVLLKGDLVEGATLVEIYRDSVKFSFNNKEFELKTKQ